MSIWQAILLGFIYYMEAFQLGPSLRQITATPLSVVLLTGLVLGDVPTAMKVGAAVQPLYIAYTGAGGTVATDKCAAGLVPAAVVITSGLPFEQAVALSVTVALALAQLHTIRRVAGATWMHIADGYASKCNIRGLMLSNFVYPNLLKIVIFWIPMTLMLYFGASFIGQMMNAMPNWLQNGLSVTGKLMPALGYAMTIRMIGRKELIPYFIGGFFFAQYSGLGSIPLACMALFLAFMDMRFSNRGEREQQQEETEQQALLQEKQHGRLLSRRDVTGAFVRWWIGASQADNFERLMALGFCVSMAPILKKLYGHDPEQLQAALQRHLLFYNTQPIWGSLIAGIVISMEEQRAMGMPVTADAIIGVKNGLMGPFAGIGDTIDFSTVQPLIYVFFIPYAAQGYWWAGLLPYLIFVAITGCEGMFFMHLGYRTGMRAAVTILQSGSIQRVITFFSVMGLFAMGGLSAGMVTVQTGLQIATSGTPMSVQTDILDKILPGLLSILSIFAVYAYLQKSGNMLKATLWLLGIGLVLGALGILA